MKILKEFGLTEKQVKQILIEKRKAKPQILKRYFSEKEIKKDLSRSGGKQLNI